jgi:hypothetical protein
MAPTSTWTCFGDERGKFSQWSSKRGRIRFRPIQIGGDVAFGFVMRTLRRLRNAVGLAVLVVLVFTLVPLIDFLDDVFLRRERRALAAVNRER